MKTTAFISSLLIFILLHFSYAQDREIHDLRSGWKFHKGAVENAHLQAFDDSDWPTIEIPHDWAIAGPFIVDGNGSTGKLPWKGEGWYRKKLDIPQEYQKKSIYLLCDGIMAFPKVYINGQLAGQWDYGYNSFYLDISDLIDYQGNNILAIHADTRKHDSRWYPGGGIFRKIRLIAVNPLHVDIWGTYITTAIIKPHYADVKIATTINNAAQKADPVIVKQMIFSGKIKILEKADTVQIKAASKKTVETLLTLPNPRRWDIDDPHLYELKTELYQNGKQTDTYVSTFGVRMMRFTADNGFYLNDRRVQFKGVNLHHDHGPLGAAFNTRAMERQLEIMKSMGCNAIRTSHNVAAPEMIELCDRMGILFFNEIFDKYDDKADITAETDFEEFAQRNVRNFVLRDRNHPSIFIWSVGNEISDVQWDLDRGHYKLQTMVNYVRKYDPTRPVTLVCDQTESAEKRHFDYYDVHAWNYNRRYHIARQMEPNKSVIVSESASTVSTRGFYEFPLPEKKTDFTKALQVSSYDLNAPRWAEIADDDFMWQQDEPYLSGEFVWTGFDYLGEPTPYDNWSLSQMGMDEDEASRSSYFGIVDLVGIPKDRYYLYKSHWKPQETTVHILPHWNWPERVAENVPVFVYTNGDNAELFLNGKSLGKRYKNPKSSKSVERFRLMWNDVIYQPGELKAVAYKDSKKIGERIIKTAGDPYRLELSADRKTISADGRDLSYILVEAYDKDGNFCPLADQKLKIKLQGDGEIAGVGNGNPQSLNLFQSNSVNLFYGKAMIIVRSVNKAGQLQLEVTAGDLQKDKVTIQMQ